MTAKPFTREELFARDRAPKLPLPSSPGAISRQNSCLPVDDERMDLVLDKVTQSHGSSSLGRRMRTQNARVVVEGDDTLKWRSKKRHVFAGCAHQFVDAVCRMTREQAGASATLRRQSSKHAYGLRMASSVLRSRAAKCEHVPWTDAPEKNAFERNSTGFRDMQKHPGVHARLRPTPASSRRRRAISAAIFA
jgi:hypothetical protein